MGGGHWEDRAASVATTMVTGLKALCSSPHLSRGNPAVSDLVLSWFTSVSFLVPTF